MLKLRIIVVACAVCASVFATAQEPVKPDDAAQYRQSLMNIIGWNLRPLRAMAKGDQPFDAAAFAKHSARIANTSDQLLEGFPKGSDVARDTRAKADIWANWDDFQAKLKDFDTQAKLLVDVSKANDETKSKEQLKNLTQTCKACHNKYEAKR